MTRDLIQALEQNRRPVCDAIDGRWIIEMVMAVHEGGLTQQTVRFPLQIRDNPYAAAAKWPSRTCRAAPRLLLGVAGCARRH